MTNSPEELSDYAIKRILVGVCALISLAAAGGVWFFTADPESSGLLSALVRVGIVLGALWLALPAQAGRFPWERALPLVIGVGLVLALARRASVVLVPIVIVIAVAALILRPKPKRRPGR